MRCWRQTKTQRHDNNYVLNFSIFIVSQVCTCSDIPSSPAYGVYVSQLIQYTRGCSTYDHKSLFYIRSGFFFYWRPKVDVILQGFLQSQLQQTLRKYHGCYNVLRPLKPHLRSIAVWCVSYLLLFWRTNFDCRLLHLPDLEIGPTEVVTGWQGMLPHRHLIPPLVYPRVCVIPLFWFVFPTGLMR
jgi:hypothetical protein